MINYEKCIRYADAFIDCIPVIRIVYNASLMWYKSAYKVNNLMNPITPGLGTSIKIHVLSKPWSSCSASTAFGVTPLYNNLCKFKRACLDGFKDDYLTIALREENSEVVRLSLGNSLNHPRARAAYRNPMEQLIRNNGLYVECRDRERGTSEGDELFGACVRFLAGVYT